MNKVAEEIKQENEELESEKYAPPPINDNPVRTAKVVWIGGVIVLDLATSYFVWQTTIALYGFIWFLVGAAGLAYSEWMRERVGNNPVQERIGRAGVAVSAFMVLIAAVGMGAVYLLGMTNQRGVMLLVEVVTVLMFAYHLVQSYRYYIEDDQYKEQNKDARLEAKNVGKHRQIQRAVSRVKHTESLESQKDELRKKYPESFDAAYSFLVKEQDLKAKTPVPQNNNHGNPTPPSSPKQ
jgi:hypothetical protein